MTNPLVSICCITYNHASFIRQCIDGFLMQKPPSSVPQGAKMSDWCEILIHDDCSTDGTIDIINEYAQKFPDLIFPLFEKENQYSRGWAGKMSLFNYKRARGKYIAYCEGDDYWTEPLKLQRQVDFLEANLDYSVTFHRCTHVNFIDSSEKDDDCGFLFKNNEAGVDIDVNLFFKHWITQPLTMVCRKSMHDMNLAYQYKYYRDTYEIFHILMRGRGYLFGFFGGVRIMHPNGIASMISEEETAIKERNFAEELYDRNRCKYTYENFLNVFLWCFDVLSRDKGGTLLYIILKMIIRFPLLTFNFLFVLLKRKTNYVLSSSNVFVKCKKYWYNLTHPVIGEVWQLHRVRPNLSSDVNLRRYEISPTRLEFLINDSLQKGYDFVSMDEVYDFVSGRKRCKSKFIAFTLDDGYEDNYSVAYPIFKKYNVPFCIYVAESYITGDKRASDVVDFKMLREEQIVELSNELLCTLGSHTKSHVRLSSLNIIEQKNEITECNTWLEKLIGKPIQHFAFPYGDYNLETLSILNGCGIKCSVAAWGGGVRKTGSVYNIPRVLVTENTIE